MRLTFILIVISICFSSTVSAAEQPTREQILDQRMNFYVKYSSVSLPWYELAAVDQFERNIQQVRNDLPEREGTVAIQFSDEYWAGPLNPNKGETNAAFLAFFGGQGKDANGDGLADRKNDDDVMLTMAEYLGEYIPGDQGFKAALKNYYKRDQSVNQIMTIAKIYKHFNTLNLDQHSFPLPVHSDYSYRSTWGDNRGWGGKRIHEGTDLFAPNGLPVKATTYGLIEVMGWNDYGGWRIGIRDVHNTYHYYAHLSSYTKGLKQGDMIKPGTVIGYVGSTGYGKKWTAGRFPPHLHYGMYKYNGRIEWAFDPYPSLRHWEQSEGVRPPSQ